MTRLPAALRLVAALVTFSGVLAHQVHERQGMAVAKRMGNEPTLDKRQDAQREYELQIGYEGRSFFDGWEFFDKPDPSWGCGDPGVRQADQIDVNYVNRTDAIDKGLAFFTDDGIPGIQADHWTHLQPEALRDSVRMTTRQLFDRGLVIIDVKLMPWGCGVWPAFWMLGYNATWPDAGEIDIIEGIQSTRFNQMAVHTKPGCTVDQTPGRFSGHLGNPVCDRASGGSGCAITSDKQDSYGEFFNLNSGGVFAMLWDDDGIKMWNWRRNEVPGDINDQDPSPGAWGLPVAAWAAGDCDPQEFFKPQTLVLNVNLCGEWAGQVYNQYDYCPGTCAEYIADPNNLNNSIWLINSIRVYQRPGYKPIPVQASTTQNLTGSPGILGVRFQPEIRDAAGLGAGLGVGQWTLLGVALILGFTVAF